MSRADRYVLGLLLLFVIYIIRFNRLQLVEEHMPGPDLLGPLVSAVGTIFNFAWARVQPKAATDHKADTDVELEPGSQQPDVYDYEYHSFDNELYPQGGMGADPVVNEGLRHWLLTQWRRFWFWFRLPGSIELLISTSLLKALCLAVVVVLIGHYLFGKPAETRWSFAKRLARCLRTRQLAPLVAKVDVIAHMLKNRDWTVHDRHITMERNVRGHAVLLGRGVFGKVYKGRWKHSTNVAVRVVEYGHQDEGLACAAVLFNDIDTIMARKSPYIVQLLGAKLEPRRIVIVSEMMEGGNLLQAVRDGGTTWYQRGSRMALEVAKGLEHLHSRGVMHHNVKSSNVLLSSSLQAKVADVGLAHVALKTNGREALRVAGTIPYVAPEMLAGRKAGPPADVYSFGILLWEICTGEIPRRSHLRDIDVPQEAPAGIVDLIARCTSAAPAARPSMAEVVAQLQSLNESEGISDRNDSEY